MLSCFYLFCDPDCICTQVSKEILEKSERTKYHTVLLIYNGFDYLLDYWQTIIYWVNSKPADHNNGQEESALSKFYCYTLSYKYVTFQDYSMTSLGKKYFTKFWICKRNLSYYMNKIWFLLNMYFTWNRDGPTIIQVDITIRIYIIWECTFLTETKLVLCNNIPSL